MPKFDPVSSDEGPEPQVDRNDPNRPLTTRPTVAIVEGDKSVRRALARLVRSYGLDVESFASASEYLEASHPNGVECLLLDIRLVDVAGYALYRRIARGGAAPILLVDSCDSANVGELARRVGAVASLGKPIDSAALFGAVQRAIAR